MLLSGALVLFASLYAPAAPAIKTPFTLVSLWSDEMMAYLTGVRQKPCSGKNAAKCERLDIGVCDGTAYFHFLPQGTTIANAPPRVFRKQTDSDDPQYFELELRSAGYGNNLYDYPLTFREIEMVFGCSISGNGGCPAGRFQTGRVTHVELSRLDGGGRMDVTGRAEVRADGPIVIPVDDAIRQSVFSDPKATYQVRAVAECFSVKPSPEEWQLPLYDGPSTTAPSAGTIIARVTAGSGMDFRYRPPAGPEVPFEPDWVQPDWGYTFQMDQTVLDVRDNWYQLPPRPFPSAVWIQLPDRALDAPRVTLAQGNVYTLSKTISARRKSSASTTVFSSGANIFVAGLRGGALEIRKEQPFDMPCNEEEEKAQRRNVATYLIDAAEFYDRDLHLQLHLAYPKGC